MLLTLHFDTHLRRMHSTAAGIVLSLTCSSLLWANKPACFADIPVYDAFGYMQPFVISSVFKAGERHLGDLLRLKDRRYGLLSVGERLYFSESAIGALLEIRLEGPNGAMTTTQVALNTCAQRSSVQYGGLDSGADVRTSSVTGHISGCNVNGDWWIKAIPMFGEYSQVGAYEGRIRTDGMFAIVASMRGGRYIVVIGKDREPVKAFSAEVIIGGKNDVGDVGLRGLCPK